MFPSIVLQHSNLKTDPSEIDLKEKLTWWAPLNKSQLQITEKGRKLLDFIILSDFQVTILKKALAFRFYLNYVK